QSRRPAYERRFVKNALNTRLAKPWFLYGAECPKCTGDRPVARRLPLAPTRRARRRSVAPMREGRLGLCSARCAQNRKAQHQAEAGEELHGPCVAGIMQLNSVETLVRRVCVARRR